MVHGRSLWASGRRGPLRLVTVAALGAALVLSACGSPSKAPPKQAIGDSFKALPSQSKLSVRISLGLTAAQVEQLSKSDSSDSSGATPAQANALATGSIFFNVQTGHGEALSSSQVKTDTANAYDFGLQIGNDIPVEVVYVDQAVYVRAQLRNLLTDVGASADKADSVVGPLQQANAEVPGLSALGQGDWVEISHASLVSLGGLLKQYASSLGSSGAAVNPSQAAAVYGKLAHDVGTALKANSTTQNAGTTGGRTDYKVTVNVQGFLTQVGPALQTDLASLPGVGGNLANDLNQAKAKIPANQTATADVFVENNQVQEIQVDVNQFVTTNKAPFPVPVKVVFGSPSSISAPSGATPLDLSKLPALLGGLMSGLGSGSSGSGSSSASS